MSRSGPLTALQDARIRINQPASKQKCTNAPRYPTLRGANRGKPTKSHTKTPFASTLSFGDSAASECHWQVIGESFRSSVLSDGAVKHAVAGQSKLSHVWPCLGLTFQKTAYSSLEVAQCAEQSWRSLWILPGSLLSPQNLGYHLETKAIYNLNVGLERIVDAVCCMSFRCMSFRWRLAFSTLQGVKSRPALSSSQKLKINEIRWHRECTVGPPLLQPKR